MGSCGRRSALLQARGATRTLFGTGAPMVTVMHAPGARAGAL